MATSAHTPVRRLAVGVDAVVPAAYALGAVALAAEAAVHVQQFADLFHGVRWIGPLFLANAVAIVVVIAGLALPRTRQLAPLAGVVISALALGSLVVSYGQRALRLAGGRLSHPGRPRRDRRGRRRGAADRGPRRRRAPARALNG
jgi:hypothetical protein